MLRQASAKGALTAGMQLREASPALDDNKSLKKLGRLQGGPKFSGRAILTGGALLDEDPTISRSLSNQLRASGNEPGITDVLVNNDVDFFSRRDEGQETNTCILGAICQGKPS